MKGLKISSNSFPKLDHNHSKINMNIVIRAPPEAGELIEMSAKNQWKLAIFISHELSVNF